MIENRISVLSPYDSLIIVECNVTLFICIAQDSGELLLVGVANRNLGRVNWFDGEAILVDLIIQMVGWLQLELRADSLTFGHYLVDFGLE